MKLLLTGAFKYTNEQIEYLKSLGNEVVFVQDEREKIGFDVSDIEGVICNGLFLYNKIEQFKSLKYIQLTSAGFDRVPLDYINDHKIKIYNARGVYSVPMAEFALTGILQLVKQSRFFYENQKHHMWEKSRTLGELSGKTAVIVGAGNIGTEVAKRLNAFDMTVIGVDICNNEKLYFDNVELFSELDEYLKIADIVVLTLPLMDSTRGMFDKTKFELMKENSIFVNLARGPLVVENDLIDSLEQKLISGAVLDVFDVEPLEKNSPLWDMKNVILTPHNSFVGENNNKRMFKVIVENLEIQNE
ncbi:NAD(P)-dependent oxidoreductase [uncultured Eubacterium sp.]|uniref:NAD(P)-dependent oxidoreductase n=1 Tax=uncultured Eubacterium sp. TaxID=165185 RepID=UPI002805D573|nr:NAD(P)-dependent oxidoreductase [uncultured Eubacterium sp.]